METHSDLIWIICPGVAGRLETEDLGESDMNTIEVTKRLLAGDASENYLHPFTPLSIRDSREDVERRLAGLRAAGIRSMNLLWSGNDDLGGYTPFNSEAYWTRIGWVAEICRREDMTFMMQDAAPFPTGLADGLLMRPEYLDRNKLYLGERHLDVRGPNPDGAFLVSELVGSIRSTDQERGFGKARPFPGDNLYAVVAVERDESGLNPQTAVDLTDRVSDGLLLWPVPEGVWRVFVIFETMNDGGRLHYINLLDPASVALNIQAIYEPHYAHLKDEAGKSWLGFFYDEAEIGNLWRYNVPTLPGDKRNVEGESMALPWSGIVRDRWEDVMESQASRALPFLWEDCAKLPHVRARFMDIVSRVMQETYNGQMHAWCRERGLQYIGHNCEDENTHCSLGNGPAHFFRMQRHQDAAGIDLIGGQLMPGKDFRQSWYGCPEGDGTYYHYGLAKLASSAAHIMPNKHGRAFCEVFAVYGDIAGTRLRKFVYDHLLVNGINEMIPAPPFVPGAEPGISRRENDYVNRMCRLMHETRPVIKAAVLYHAEAEWYAGDFDRFQKVGKELAQAQISYDVVPADVFEDTAFFETDCADGLRVNGNRYEALIVPKAEALPAALARALERGEPRIPVIFCERRPGVIVETGEPFRGEGGEVVPMNALAERLRQIIPRDFALDRALPDLRCAHFRSDDVDYYFLVNQGSPCAFEAYVAGDGALTAVDIMEDAARRLPAERKGDGLTCRLSMDRWESLLLVAGESDEALSPAWSHEVISPTWHVTLEDGTELEMDALRSINAADLFPRYMGKVVYEAAVTLGAQPTVLRLGEVWEIAEVSVNGQRAGIRQWTPYEYDIRGLTQIGENRLRVAVWTGRARETRRESSSAFGRSMSATVYNVLPPGGLLGPVTLGYEKD